MAYSTNSDLTARIPDRVIVQLCDDEKLTADGDTLAAAIVKNAAIQTRITAAIADADCAVDMYIRKRFSVPVATVPASLAKLSADLAIFGLHNRRQSEFEVPGSVMANRKAAMDALKAVASGEIDLGVEPQPAASTAVVAATDGEDRIFTAETLEDF
jgi:phage gp36-like protein